MATKLEHMRIDEVSGVDIPANLTDGWLLTKSVTDAIDAPEPDESVLKRVAAWFRKAEASTTDSREEEIDMTEEELTKALEAQTEAIGKSVGDAVAAALSAQNEAAEAANAEAERVAAEAAAAEAAATVTEPAADEVPATVSAEQFGELSERVEAIAKALEPVLEAVGSLVKKSVTRTSIPEPADAVAEPVAKSAKKEPAKTTGIFERLAAGETSVRIGNLVS